LKSVIVPFFIAHQGCPHQCLFCDQKAITGIDGALPTPDEIVSTVGKWLASSRALSVEVAFYGGSFTLLGEREQRSLLEPLQPLLRAGTVSSIRLSTRPDAVDARRAAFLREAGVSLVELGVQSMDDSILEAAGRGHTAQDTAAAIAALRAAGLGVGAQIMPGLPGDSAEGARDSFNTLLALKPDLLRIYPAVVLRGTGLARLFTEGSYTPLTLESAISICKVLLQDAAVAGIPVIRAGLQPTDDLSSGSELLAGPYHPAFRQLADSERWYDLLWTLLADSDTGDELTIHSAPSRLSDVIGQGRCNVKRLEESFRVHVKAVMADSGLENSSIRVAGGDRTISGNLLTDLRYNLNSTPLNPPLSGGKPLSLP
jgi:histone acetyltransferase (RNA polymerase elongator complex component)